VYDDIPGASQEWKAISTERNGLVNLSREYGLPLREPNRAVAWLKTTMNSDRKQTKKVDIGWTREVWVFVNGRLVYADKNLFDQEAGRKFPDGRCSLEMEPLRCLSRLARMRSRWQSQITSSDGD
jgi:hypothetical protein